MDFTLQIFFISAISLAICDPLQWVVTNTKLPTPLLDHSAVYDGDDSIYVFGGYGDQPGSNDRVFKYSLSSETITELPPFLGVYNGAALIYDQDIFFFGGFTPSSIRFQITRYSTRNGTYANVNNLPAGLVNPALAWNAAARIAYLFGGSGYNGVVNYILQYNPEINTIEEVSQLPGGRDLGTAVWATGFGRAYYFGGNNGSSTAQRDVHRYDAATRVVTKLSTRLPADVLFGCSVYVNGHAYILQHFAILLKFNPATETAEVVDVDEATWPVRFERPTCLYIPKLARIYVIGGKGHFQGEPERYMDDIAYIALDN